MWESLSDVTCCRSLVVVYESSCVLQIGFSAESTGSDGGPVGVDASKLMQGSLCHDVMKSGARKFVIIICQLYIICHKWLLLHYSAFQEDVK